MLKDHVRLLWGPVLAIVVGSIAYGAGMSPIMAKVTTVALWMMIWWLDNFVRLGITGLLPIVLLPLLAVNPGNQVSSIYFSDGMILCIGSLLMASAIESCHLHILAAKLINRYSAARGLTFILFLFVMITGFLSMWISNTATAALMLPIANAFIETLTARQAKANDRRTKEKIAAVGSALDLSIAFASSIGGMATLIGTGSNIVLMGVMKNVFGEDNHEVSFLGWLVMAGPLSLINLLWLWLLLSAAFIWRWPWLYRFVRSDLDDDADGGAGDANGGDDDSEASGPPSRSPSSTINGSHSNNPLHQQSEMDSVGHVYRRHRGSSADDDAGSRTRSLEEIALELPSDEVTAGVRQTKQQQQQQQQQQEQPAGPHAASEASVDGSFRLTYRSKAVMWTFTAMAVLWMTRDPPGKWGWAYALGVNAYVTDGTVAMAACLFLMILPANPVSWAELCSGRWWKTSRGRVMVVGRRHRSHLLPTHDDGHLHSAHPVDTIHLDDDHIDSHNHRYSHSHSHSHNSSLFHEAQDVEMVAFPSSSVAHLARSSPSPPPPPLHTSGTTTTATTTEAAPVSSDHASSSSSSSHPQHHHHYEAVLPWTAVQSLNWDVVFLLGGGFALSLGFEASGLSQWISQLMVQNGPHTLPGFILVASLLSCLVTNVMSNVAAANVILPSLVCLGPQYHQSPLAVLMPVTLSISLALLFPMGTPPNAIIMTNKRVDSAQLLKTGALLTVLTLSTVIVYSIFVLPVVGDFRTVSATVHSVCGTS